VRLVQAILIGDLEADAAFPDALELIDGHGAAAPGRVGEKDAIADGAAIDDEVTHAAAHLDRDDAWAELVEVAQGELAIAVGLEAARDGEALQIEQREAQLPAHLVGRGVLEHRRGDFALADWVV